MENCWMICGQVEYQIQMKDGTETTIQLLGKAAVVRVGNTCSWSIPTGGFWSWGSCCM